MNRNDLKILSTRSYRARTRTQATRKTSRFSERIAILIESGFQRENRHPFCIKTLSFANVNYNN